MVIKMKAVLYFVAAICAASVGFILLYNPGFDAATEAETAQLEIAPQPVPMGAEVSFNEDLNLLCEGGGAIEVTPYKSSYANGEQVTFTARPLDGWSFERWEGDIPDGGQNSISFTARMTGEKFSVKAVFIRE
jgi:hypothetical protein